MTILTNKRTHSRLLNPTLFVVSLGNFVDAFDLFLYNALRSTSLNELGLSGEELTRAGIQILNFQVLGMFLGGFIWGFLGDKIGRKKALVGSVLLYSLGSLGCALVHSVFMYEVMRFFTGIGLAGELGLGAVLVLETLPDEKRNWALGIFAASSALAIFASNAMPEFLSWRWCYAVGCLAGLILLLVRVMMFESTLFEALSQTKSERWFSVLDRPDLIKRWFSCVLLYLPQCFATGFLLTLSPEIGKAVGVTTPVKANVALMVYFAGQFAADLIGVAACNIFKCRKPVAFAYLFLASLMVSRYLMLEQPSALDFYLCCGVMGLCSFFVLSVFITVEQFGTNLRATASTSALSSSRTMLIVTNLLYLALRGSGLGIIVSIASVSSLVFLLGFFSLLGVRETYQQTMDFVE